MFDDTITLAQLIASPWKEALEVSERYDCFGYQSAFMVKIQELGKSSEHIVTLSLLSRLFSMYMTNDCVVMETDSSLIQEDKKKIVTLQDITDEQADELFLFLDHIDDSVLKGVIADIIWICKKGKRKNLHLAARIAITAFNTSSKLLYERNDPLGAVEQLERSVEIAAELGQGGVKLMQSTLKISKETLEVLSKDEIDACQYRLLVLLFERNYKNLDELGKIASELGERIFLQGINWELIRSYFDLISNIFYKANRFEGAFEARKRKAWTYVLQAARSKYFIKKAHFLATAIEAFRNTGQQKNKIDLLHKWLLRVQCQTEAEMYTYDNEEIDLSAYIKESQRKVSGKKFWEAMVQFALIDSLIDSEQLKKVTKRETKKYIFSNMFETCFQGTKGKILAKFPPVGIGNTEICDDVIIGKMHWYFCQDCDIHVKAFIDPARRQLLQEHTFNPEDFLPILINHKFIPEGRELIYARGLAAGFAGDFLVAEHLLIPQIENSLRYVIEQHGGIASTIRDGIQRERMLPDLLDDKLIVKEFGELLIFAFKTLLVEHTGANHRHRLCHGLLGYEEFYSYSSVYVWWLVFRICCLPWGHESLKK